jgi:hypothetical protein
MRHSTNGPRQPDAVQGSWDPLENREYIRVRNEAEKLMREAMACRKLDTFVTNPMTGAIERIVDVADWEKPSGFMALGLDTYVDHLVNPGPEVDGQPVFLLKSQFTRIASQIAAKLKAAQVSYNSSGSIEGSKVQKADVEAIYSTMVNGYEVGGRRPSVEEEQRALEAQGVRVSRDRVRELRRKLAPQRRGRPRKMAS